MFHGFVAFNNFPFKIGIKDSPDCTFCDRCPKTLIHICYDCNYVSPIFSDLMSFINQNLKDTIQLGKFEFFFRVPHNIFLTYFFFALNSLM